MKESLVVSRELCEQLKDAGMEQSGWEFYWIWHSSLKIWRLVSEIHNPNGAEHYAAPLAGELATILPRGVHYGRPRMDKIVKKPNSIKKEDYACFWLMKKIVLFDDTLPNALALMALELNVRGLLNF